MIVKIFSIVHCFELCRVFSVVFNKLEYKLYKNYYNITILAELPVTNDIETILVT